MFLHLAVNECKRQVEWTAVLKIRPSLLFNLDGLSVGSEDSRLVCLLLHPLQGALHKLGGFLGCLTGNCNLPSVHGHVPFKPCCVDSGLHESSTKVQTSLT